MKERKKEKEKRKKKKKKKKKERKKARIIQSTKYRAFYTAFTYAINLKKQ